MKKENKFPLPVFVGVRGVITGLAPVTVVSLITSHLIGTLSVAIFGGGYMWWFMLVSVIGIIVFTIVLNDIFDDVQTELRVKGELAETRSSVELRALRERVEMLETFQADVEGAMEFYNTLALATGDKKEKKG